MALFGSAGSAASRQAQVSSTASTSQPAEAAASRRPHRRTAAAGRLFFALSAGLAVLLGVFPTLLQSDSASAEQSRSPATAPTPAPAFLALDEKDGRFCGKEGDMCKCFGHVRYGRLFTWSDDIIVDGSVNCSAATFGDPMPMDVKICKCYPTICTTDMGICTPEPCSCPTSRDPEVEWGKKTLMTGDGTKCWACEKKASTAGVAEDSDSPFCPVQVGRCSLNRACKCEEKTDTKRVMRTKDGQKCWTCAPAGEGGGGFGMDSGQKAMFWMLPLLWPWMDFPDSVYQVMEGCRALTTFIALCLVGYICQNFVQFLRLDRFFSFYAPCMKKGEFWRLFTYFMLHSDLQHLCTNLFHLLDALDLEGVPDMEVSPGVPLKCTRDGPVAGICYPDVGIGFYHTIGVFALVLAYGALVGTIKSFGALVQGASSVCFGVDGALIALYAMFLGAGLDSQLKIPEFGSFFWMRIGIIAFHIIIDIVQSVCGSGKDTVGTVAHMASLVAGFCYVILVLPPMGDGSLFDSLQPYIIPCGMTSPQYTTLETANTECIAFFRRGNGIELETARKIAAGILGGGVLISIANAIRNRHISDDGIACCTCGEVPKGEGPAGAGGRGEEQDDAQNELKQHAEALTERLTQLNRLYQNMPDSDALAAAERPPVQAAGAAA